LTYRQSIDRLDHQDWHIVSFILNCFQPGAIPDVTVGRFTQMERQLPEEARCLPRVAIWLVPREPERKILQSLIAGLATRFSAPEFVPHVTVYSCQRSSPQKELAITAALAARCPPLTLRPLGLACSDRLTQAFFVRLASDETLQWLRNSLQKELPCSSAGDFAPHLSLLYHVLPLADRVKLAEETRFSFREIIFDQIWTVAIPGAITAAEHLSGWQTLFSCRLAYSEKTDKIQVRGFTHQSIQGDDHARQD
jgi:hypothetical protein